MAVIERETYSPEAVQDSLGLILDAVRSVYEPEKIILYGSAAEGRPWHDLDLVVIAETNDRFIDPQMKLAKALSRIRHVPADIFVYTPQEACFAGQQCVEKLLKAYLLSKGRVPPRIHELPALLTQCAEVEAGVRQLEPQAALLDRYYIAARYPDAWLPGGPYGEDDARSAIDAATQFLAALEVPILEWLKDRE